MAKRRIELVITHRFEPELADALARMLAGGAVAPQAEVPQAPPRPAPELPRRRRGRPRKEEAQPQDIASPLPVSARPVSSHDLRGAFRDLADQQGGELRAATVLAQFETEHVADAQPEQYAELFEALRSALTQN